MSNPQVQERKAGRPTFMLIGGRPGSGRSLFGTPGPAQVYDPARFLVVGVDQFTDMIRQGEIQSTGKALYGLEQSLLYHAESVYLCKQSIIEARARGLDVVLELTMQNDVRGWVPPFRAAGYRIEAHYMCVSPGEAAKRVLIRWRDGPPPMEGRLIPVELVLGMTRNDENWKRVAALADRL